MDKRVKAWLEKLDSMVDGLSAKVSQARDTVADVAGVADSGEVAELRGAVEALSAQVDALVTKFEKLAEAPAKPSTKAAAKKKTTTKKKPTVVK